MTIPYLSPRDAQHLLPLHPIDKEPWPAYRDDRCQAFFSISHYNKGIRIRYVVDEPWLRVRKRQPNTAVHKDNCVEFFFAPVPGDGYYNFEFNCMGSVKAAFGATRHHRTSLPTQVVRKIANLIHLSIDNFANQGSIHWDMVVTIPLTALCHHRIGKLSGLTCSANFAKCGDELPVSHYKSWRPIVSPHPDFHKPDAFGDIMFATKKTDKFAAQSIDSL